MKQAYDVIVVGSGAAGLIAALAAAASGASVLVVEKTSFLGGTSAMSGAGIWVPANHLAATQGIKDSPEDALAYIRAASPASYRATYDEHWRRFTEMAPEMLKFVEQHTPVRFALTPEGDPYPDCIGAKPLGRMLSTLPLRRAVAGKWAKRIRQSTMPHRITYQEMIAYDVFHHPLKAMMGLAPAVAWRTLTDTTAKGSALIAGLLRGCLDTRCDLLINARARAFTTNGMGRVTGIRLQVKENESDVVARSGVVLATGGFEWNDEMRMAHFPGPIDYIGSPPSNTGDGHHMALQIGAYLDQMTEANIVSALPTRYEGNPSALPVKFHAEGNVIIVDRTGRRFISEYDFNIGVALNERLDVQQGPKHQPAWLISDADFLRRSPMIRWYARNDPSWMATAPTINRLASKLGVPPQDLSETVTRYNAFCRTGFDQDFQRGESTYEASIAQKAGKLEPIRRSPFLAIRLNRSILGTKGGIRTTATGKALRDDGSIIEGLYCAGAVAAGFIGTYAISSGTTLGPYMTCGYLCGKTICS